MLTFWSQILSAPLPRAAKGSHAQPMEVEPAVLAEPNESSADSLVSSNDPDDLVNEQTWPTEEEMNGNGVAVPSDIPDAVEGTTPKVVRRIPKGMSEYQAAWIIDEDEDDGDENKESGDDTGTEGMEEDEEEEMQDIPMEETPTEVGGVRFEDLDAEEEEEQ